ncbi:hypothetical protein LCGC14_1085080 [marine sediment metagenome]|uniref:Uncharacterized protein n=1 Tax=marine sediment metagenome TaxID=412755 RepID=A0A0F9ME87_9ZZZZ
MGMRIKAGIGEYVHEDEYDITVSHLIKLLVADYHGHYYSEENEIMDEVRARPRPPTMELHNYHKNSSHSTQSGCSKCGNMRLRDITSSDILVRNSKCRKYRCLKGECSHEFVVSPI